LGTNTFVNRSLSDRAVAAPLKRTPVQSGELIGSGRRVQNRQLVPFGTIDPAPLFPFELVELPNKCSVRHMKRVEAKIEENRKEDSASEPDKDPNTWLIEAKVRRK
jgi:hypothetical protein